MITITVTAVVLFLAVTLTDFFEFVLLSIVWCILPTPLVVTAIYGRGHLQAYAIGALVPWTALIALRYPALGSSFLAASIWLLPNCAICATLAAATRRWLLARGRD